ncbi:MAG: hypothetical protein RIR67_1349 [Bacteroidota bacterium]|jgi:hypothetical protein
MTKFKKKLIQQIIILLGFLYCLPLIGQENNSLIRLKVLKANTIDSLYIFGKLTDNGGEETHLKYLGQFKATNGQTYKVMTSIYFWGLSKHATSNILIYNKTNEYIGNYNVWVFDDLPVRLENGILIFKNKEECDKIIANNIDLKNGIPKQIFLKCQGENGDLYNFTSEKNKTWP